MKKLLSIFLVCTQLHAQSLDPMQSYVATKKHGGRLGDQIIINLQAITASKEMGIPYLHRPFAGSDQLALSSCGQWLTPEEENLFRRQTTLRSLPLSRKTNSRNVAPHCLYLVPHGSRVPIVGKAEARKLLAPISPIPKIDIPPDCVSVAVHVRTGGGRGIENGQNRRELMDHPANQRRFPQRFVSKLGYGFYTRSLKRLRHIFKNQKLYVHLFTDDKNPKQIIEKLSSALGDENIYFGCREEGNRYDKNVIEDFHGMTQFNCLIRPDSNMSRMAEYISNHCVVICPGGCKTSHRACKKLKQRLRQKSATPQTPAS